MTAIELSEDKVRLITMTTVLDKFWQILVSAIRIAVQHTLIVYQTNKEKFWINLISKIIKLNTFNTFLLY